jgi:DNA-binding GntR family transcriptional regulator
MDIIAKSTRNSSDLIRERLEDAIATGELGPGARLDETELANRFQVSRTPVREALHQLASIRLVEIRPRRGAIVPELDPQAIVEMFEMMGELESSCARLAARRHTAHDRASLEAAHQACLSGGADVDPDHYYRENEAFHRALYHAGHNRLLESETLALQRRLRPYRRLQLRLPDRIGSSRREHALIVAAILAHDPNAAADAARDHVLIQGHGFGDFLALLHHTPLGR